MRVIQTPSRREKKKFRIIDWLRDVDGAVSRDVRYSTVYMGGSRDVYGPVSRDVYGAVVGTYMGLVRTYLGRLVKLIFRDPVWSKTCLLTFFLHPHVQQEVSDRGAALAHADRRQGRQKIQGRKPTFYSSISWCHPCLIFIYLLVGPSGPFRDYCWLREDIHLVLSTILTFYVAASISSLCFCRLFWHRYR